MRLLILGANGQLGRELTVALSPLGEIHVATRDGRTASGRAARAADLTRPEQLVEVVREVRPAVLINAAAYTAVDRAEEEPDVAQRVNAEAPAVLAEESARAGSLLVHYSTDYVFGEPGIVQEHGTPASDAPEAAGRLLAQGRAVPAGRPPRPWRESDPAAPLSVYGRTKLAGEEALRASGCPHLILRTSWLYAGHGHNFLRTMLRLAAERDELRVVDDQTGSPTWARCVAVATAAILARLPAETPAAEAMADRGGTYHLAAAGETTWHRFATALFRIADTQALLPRTPTVNAISSREFSAPAPRPAYSVLDCALAKSTFGVQLPDWESSLTDCLVDLASGPR